MCRWHKNVCKQSIEAKLCSAFCAVARAFDPHGEQIFVWSTQMFVLCLGVIRGISKVYIRHFAWANGRVVAGSRGAREARAGGAAPPREGSAPLRGIDTSFELVAMETADWRGGAAPRDGARDIAKPAPRAPNEKIDTTSFGTNPSIKFAIYLQLSFQVFIGKV